MITARMCETGDDAGNGTQSPWSVKAHDVRATVRPGVPAMTPHTLHWLTTCSFSSIAKRISGSTAVNRRVHARSVTRLPRCVRVSAATRSWVSTVVRSISRRGTCKHCSSVGWLWRPSPSSGSSRKELYDHCADRRAHRSERLPGPTPGIRSLGEHNAARYGRFLEEATRKASRVTIGAGKGPAGITPETRTRAEPSDSGRPAHSCPQEQ